MRRIWTVLGMLSAIASACILSRGRGVGRWCDVYPGEGTPIQDAIDGDGRADLIRVCADGCTIRGFTIQGADDCEWAEKTLAIYRRVLHLLTFGMDRDVNVRHVAWDVDIGAEYYRIFR